MFSIRIDDFWRTTLFVWDICERAVVDGPAVEDGRDQADDQRTADGGPESRNSEPFHQERREFQQQRVQDHEEESERKDDQWQGKQKENRTEDHIQERKDQDRCNTGRQAISLQAGDNGDGQEYRNSSDEDTHESMAHPSVER